MASNCTVDGSLQLAEHVITFSGVYVVIMLLFLFFVLYAGSLSVMLLNILLCFATWMIIPLVVLLLVYTTNSDTTLGVWIFNLFLMVLLVAVVAYYICTSVMLYLASQTIKAFLPTVKNVFIYKHAIGVSRVAFPSTNGTITVVVMGSTHYLQDGNNKRLAMGKLGTVPTEVVLVTAFRAIVYTIHTASVFNGDTTTWREASDGFVVYKLEKSMSLSKFKASNHLNLDDTADSSALFNNVLKQA